MVSDGKFHMLRWAVSDLDRRRQKRRSLSTISRRDVCVNPIVAEDGASYRSAILRFHLRKTGQYVRRSIWLRLQAWRSKRILQRLKFFDCEILRFPSPFFLSAPSMRRLIFERVAQLFHRRHIILSVAIRYTNIIFAIHYRPDAIFKFNHSVD
jgi:hypothetical protein